MLTYLAFSLLRISQHFALASPWRVALVLPCELASTWHNRDFAKGVARTVSLPISSVFFHFFPFSSVFFRFLPFSSWMFFSGSDFFRFLPFSSVSFFRFLSVALSEKAGRHRSRDPFCETPKRGKFLRAHLYMPTPWSKKKLPKAKVRAADGKAPAVVFHKTRMCRFHILGKCTRGLSTYQNGRPVGPKDPSVLKIVRSPNP